MKLLNKINSDPRQQFTLVGDKGEQISFLLYYLQSQTGWFFDIAYGEFALSGARLTTHPNILRNYNNNIPFGLACVSEDGDEPLYIDDFSTNRIRLYLLSAADVEVVESEFFS